MDLSLRLPETNKNNNHQFTPLQHRRVMQAISGTADLDKCTVAVAEKMIILSTYVAVMSRY